MTVANRPVLRYIGSKWSIADWIIGHFPPHDAYVEPFFGSGAVLFCKERSRTELVNDIDDDVVNLFRIIRDRPTELAALVALTPYSRTELLDVVAARQGAGDLTDLERARIFLVHKWQTRGGADDRRRPGWRFDMRGAARKSLAGQWAQLPERIVEVVERLQGVAIEHRPALEVIALASRGRMFGKPVGQDCLIYADPPYMLSTRGDRLYAHEMSDQDHIELLAALELHPGPVLLSGYPNRLYEERLGHWQRVERSSRNQANTVTTEVLWLNAVAARHAVLPLRWEASA